MNSKTWRTVGNLHRYPHVKYWGRHLRDPTLRVGGSQNPATEGNPFLTFTSSTLFFQCLGMAQTKRSIIDHHSPTFSVPSLFFFVRKTFRNHNQPRPNNKILQACTAWISAHVCFTELGWDLSRWLCWAYQSLGYEGTKVTSVTNGNIGFFVRLLMMLLDFVVYVILWMNV